MSKTLCGGPLETRSIMENEFRGFFFGRCFEMVVEIFFVEIPDAWRYSSTYD